MSFSVRVNKSPISLIIAISLISSSSGISRTSSVSGRLQRRSKHSVASFFFKYGNIINNSNVYTNCFRFLKHSHRLLQANPLLLHRTDLFGLRINGTFQGGFPLLDFSRSLQQTLCAVLLRLIGHCVGAGHCVAGIVFDSIV